jgi:hypothetical protein
MDSHLVHSPTFLHLILTWILLSIQLNEEAYVLEPVCGLPTLVTVNYWIIIIKLPFCCSRPYVFIPKAVKREQHEGDLRNDHMHHHKKSIFPWLQVTSCRINPCSDVALIPVHPNYNGAFVGCRRL